MQLDAPVLEYTTPRGPRRGRLAIPHYRWVIAALLFLAAVLNYVDRQALSLLKPTIADKLHLTDRDYGHINSLFLIAYTAAYVISGRLVDRWGPRLSMAIFLTWWSVSNMLTAFARSVTSLGCFRFMLGLGEAGNWPASATAVGEWFPAGQRALAIGFYTMGATIGATIAPILVLRLSHFGWQAAFVATGAMGLLWILPWLLLYPKREPSGSAAGQSQDAVAPKESEARRWLRAISLRDVWLLMLARLLTDPVWYFYQQWFPSYLNTERHVGQSRLTITWIVFLAADVGTLIGGIASALLMKRSRGPAGARLGAMLACAALMPLSILIPQAHSLAATIALASVVVLAHLAWLANISALVVDVIPRHLLATCFGIAAAGSALGGIVMNDLVAGMATRHAYGAWFMLTAALHPIAWLLLWAFCSRPEAAAVESSPIES